MQSFLKFLLIEHDCILTNLPQVLFIQPLWKYWLESLSRNDLSRLNKRKIYEELYKINFLPEQKQEEKDCLYDIQEQLEEILARIPE